MNPSDCELLLLQSVTISDRHACVTAHVTLILKKKLAPLSAITLRPLCCRFVFGLRWQPEIDRHIHVATVARTNELNIPLTCGFEDGMSGHDR
jgi:hypothetical protein